MSLNDELDAWTRSREATARIVQTMNDNRKATITMSVPYAIDYDDLGVLIEALESVENPSMDAQRLLLGALLNRRNNDIANRDSEMLETSLAESIPHPRPDFHNGPDPIRFPLA